MRFARWYRQRAMTDHLLLAQSTGAQPACAVSAMVHRTRRAPLGKLDDTNPEVFPTSNALETLRVCSLSIRQPKV